LPYLGPYQEVALYVRELLKCDYALVAVPDRDTIRIQAIAGAEHETTSKNLGADLISRLRGWGPVVVDDSRLIAVPVTRDGSIIGVLMGYSTRPGTFTTSDLEKLTAYSHVAVGMIAEAAREAAGET